MLLKNAHILSHAIEQKGCTVLVEHDKIAKITNSCIGNIDSEETIDCSNLYLIPGLIDIHLHGCNGHDFCEGTKTALDAITEYQIQHGITSICPTTMTYNEEKLAPVMQNAANYKNESASEIIGINMEGPFISAGKIGAQNPDYLQAPNLKMLDNLQAKANALIKLVDIAPELDGSIDFIKSAKDKCIVSLAHTCTDYDTAVLAYRAGAKHLTHCFNAMNPIHHREPGPILAALDCGASAEIICDGLHIHYSAIRMAVKLFGDKLCLISDSCEATGLDDGQYSLGGQAIYKTGNKVVLKDKPDTIAASATNLFDCMKNAIFGAKIDMLKAICAATINPAKAIGVEDMYGSIEVGKYADFVLIDKDFNIKHVVKHGKKVM